MCEALFIVACVAYLGLVLRSTYRRIEIEERTNAALQNYMKLLTRRAQIEAEKKS